MDPLEYIMNTSNIMMWLSCLLLQVYDQIRGVYPLGTHIYTRLVETFVTNRIIARKALPMRVILRIQSLSHAALSIFIRQYSRNILTYRVLL